MIEKKVITKPIDYAILKQLSIDFNTRFVPQTESSVEQSFWSRYSVQTDEPNLSGTTIVEVPKELPKVSMFDCLNVDACAHCVTTESELKLDFIKKECYEMLLHQYHILETHFISLEVNNQLNTEIFQRDTVSSPESALTFAELFEINDLKAQVQEKDTVILKLREKLNSLSGDDKERKVKREVEEIETQNLELDHKLGCYIMPSQDNTKKNRIQRTQKKAKETELEDHLRTVKSSLHKVSVVDSKATSSVIKSVSNVNSNLKCASCNGCLFSDNHDACVVAYINSVNARKKSKSVKTPVKRKVWKSTSKVFKTVGYIWKPTGRTFTLVGNVCPLTRITTATIVPLREPIPIVKRMDKPVVTL
nr:hypothetical protein [Tanacetum cinerariifolium]